MPDYEAARLGAACSESDWRLIKSRGRQGVLRAYTEGGSRKARVKLAKLLAAANHQEATPIATVSVAPGSGCAKKRRRRANQRERAEANAKGSLTAQQLFTLFGAQSSSWQRITEWGQLPIHTRRHPARKTATHAAWRKEFSRFEVEFGAEYNGTGTSDPQEYALFVSSVAQAVAAGPDANVASKLWTILHSKGLSGSTVGKIEVPLAEDSIGARMLRAMGWKGRGLGIDEQGMIEPIRVQPTFL